MKYKVLIKNKKLSPAPECEPRGPETAADAEADGEESDEEEDADDEEEEVPAKRSKKKKVR